MTFSVHLRFFYAFSNTPGIVLSGFSQRESEEEDELRGRTGEEGENVHYWEQPFKKEGGHTGKTEFVSTKYLYTGQWFTDHSHKYQVLVHRTMVHWPQNVGRETGCLISLVILWCTVFIFLLQWELIAFIYHYIFYMPDTEQYSQ